MGLLKLRKMSSNVGISDAARKEIEFLFHHEIVTYMEKFKIPHTLVLNLDQTAFKYVPVSNERMVKRGSFSVTILGSDNNANDNQNIYHYTFWKVSVNATYLWW